MHFFDTTPTGRILTRFSKDVDVLDSTLPELLLDWVICAVEVTFFLWDGEHDFEFPLLGRRSLLSVSITTFFKLIVNNHFTFIYFFHFRILILCDVSLLLLR
uniref:Canalicular multispecific organic anion transporter 1 n=1 Tax=Culex pipiens TaxID=7175 RepID=A0A8D8D1N2_CULPI